MKLQAFHLIRTAFAAAAVAALTLGAASMACAGLGDNPAAITKAYGQPIDAGKRDKAGLTTNLYKRGPLLVLVQFNSDNVVVAQAYSRADGKELSKDQMGRFIRENGNSKFWDAKPGSDNILIRRDKKAEAKYFIAGKRPTFWIRSL